MAEFKFLDAAFLESGKMDENGRRQLTKRFLYRLKEGDRKLALIQLGEMVPKLGTGMVEDSRYVCKSAAWDCLSTRNNAKEYYIDVLYDRVSDDEVASAPWNLKPFNCKRDTVSLQMPFTMAFDDQNERTILVANSAGDPFSAETTEKVRQFTFSFYAQNYGDVDELKYGNSVNKDFQRVLGINCAAKTLLLLPFSITKLVTYENDGVTVKWEYYQIDMVMRHRTEGWERCILDVGNRAIFDGKYPEQIYQYFKVSSEGAMGSEILFTNAKTYEKANLLYQKTNNIVLPYELAENVPLTKGKVDMEIIKAQTTEAADKKKKTYPVRKFREFPVLSWRALDLPEDLTKRGW